MVDWGKFFRKEPAWYRVDLFMRNAFSRVKSDIHNLSSWVHFFKHKDEINENHHSHFNRELGEQRMMITFLNSELQKMKLEVQTLKSGTTRDKSKDILGTSQGQVQDNTGHVIEHKKSIGNDGLTGSQQEVLELLYSSDRPLSYNEIAKRLQKAPKSIRNLIYEIREKGMEVKDKPVGFRTKGFYLTEQTKITISGR